MISHEIEVLEIKQFQVAYFGDQKHEIENDTMPFVNIFE